MIRLLLGVAALLLASAATSAQAQPGRQVSGVVETPTNCQWIDAPGGDRVQDLWCRDQDGRAHITSTQRRDTRDYADTGCPRGQMDNGVRCVPEAVALEQADTGYTYQPMPGSVATTTWWQNQRTPDGRWRDPSAPVVVYGTGYGPGYYGTGYYGSSYYGSGYRRPYVGARYYGDNGYSSYGHYTGYAGYSNYNGYYRAYPSAHRNYGVDRSYLGTTYYGY